MDRSNHEYILLLGSDSGDSEQLMADAVRLIATEVAHVVRRSKLYNTEAWGFSSERIFLNQAVVVKTVLEPRALLLVLLGIERQLGRERVSQVGYVSRTMDIDILHWSGGFLNEVDLIIPHPRVHERKFALVPLCEVAADREHPLRRKTYAELLSDCVDTCKVSWEAEK